MKLKHRIKAILFILFLTATAGAWAGYAWWMADLNTPAGSDPSELVVEVLQGEGFSRVVQKLSDQSLIRHPVSMRIFARWTGNDRRIKNGEYVFTRMMTPRNILEDMVNGKVRLHRITIPEGFSLQQIAEVVEKSGLFSAEAFLKSARDPGLSHRLGVESPNLEGYLFPDTYFFDKKATVEQMISAMVARFDSIFTDAWKQRARELGLGIQAVVTLASIVEKETGNSAERPLIAAVFRNRLKIGMRLESDPTIIYGIEGFDGNITREHLKARTPYNTYQIDGLPPTPIASPGKASLEAVLFPADVPYLFFVSKGDGTHVFSLTLEEHNRAVRTYQLSRGGKS